MTLTELAAKYGVDKLASHSYLPLYEELFRDRTIKRLLEIGVGFSDLMTPFVPFYVHGASLKMWRDAFPEAEIFGCDIREDTLFQDDRIHTMVCDQTDADQLVALGRKWGPFEIIIDDGSHELSSQIVTASVLLHHLTEGGVFITEDCREPERLVEVLGEGEIHRFNKRPDDVLVICYR